MKAEFDKEGTLTIIPENPIEDSNLSNWFKGNEHNECCKVILFERFNK